MHLRGVKNLMTYDVLDTLSLSEMGSWAPFTDLV